ncbi:hypothetical protein [uncultured Ramlibacter sp.]|uniref:hypothetical protein n=1 Tax=uncultured Ramlibacter sp. TaxID=260755 RepID=UPI0026226F2A|nr:hypothetical protein [uncultured Ramlibacter sp.]
MPKLRLLYDNAADRCTVTASTTSGTLAADNLLTDIKSEVWRSTGTTAALTLEFDDAELCSMLALPFCNLTSTATFRLRGYTNVDDVDPIVDTGEVLASAYQPFGLWEWGAALGVNAFSYSGGVYGRVYFTASVIRKLVLDIVDTDNPSGYIEAARVVTGSYWSPQFNASYGVELGLNDQSKHERSDASDLRTTRGGTWRSLTFQLDRLEPADRQRMYEILRGNGLSRPFFISLFPEDGDPSVEQSYQLYGKLARAGVLGLPTFAVYNTALSIEEI